MTQCMFDRPQYDLKPDPFGPRMYANVSNEMEVVNLRGEFVTVPVAVPTGLFTIMKDVISVPPTERVTLSIDATPKGEDVRYVFSLMYADHLYDLWDYSLGSLPKWIANRL